MINTDVIRLDQFLKWANVVSSGSEAKFIIQDGAVSVNNEITTARSKKLFNGDIVSVQGSGTFKVSSQS